MLLEFKATNYKTFKGEFVFSLEPTTQRDLEYSILNQDINNKTHRALCSAVIYGPNAAGKTNIVGAMDTMKHILLRGNVRNGISVQENPARTNLELIPNSALRNAQPVSFSIKFIDAGILFKYSVTIDLGKFLDVPHQRKILREYFAVNDIPVFTREETLTIHNLSEIKNYVSPQVEQNMESALSFATNNLSDTELFLTNGFKNIYSSNIVEIFLNWIREKFVTICHGESVFPKANIPSSEKFYINKHTTDAARALGITSNALAYKKEGDGDPKLYSFVDSGEKDGSGFIVPADLYESYGTLRFVNQFPFIAQAFRNGGTLVVDEFDASLHPMVLMSIITIFHNDEINVNGAQIIFNTHNPIFLDGRLFRRDEIKFVERNEDSGESELYSLSDFGTSGESGVRKGENYMKNYFYSRYGAIKDIDFSPIFKELTRRPKR